MKMPHTYKVLGALEIRKFLHRHLVLLLLLTTGALSVYLSHGTLLSGDEVFYFQAGQFWSRFVLSWVHGAPFDFGKFGGFIVANGWFLPGMGIILAPAHLVYGGDAPVEFIRGYATVVNLGVIFLIIRGLVKLGVPKGFACLYFLISCAIPYYLFYLGALWGDLFAAHLAILLLISLERSLLADNASIGLNYKQALTLGFMLGAIALIRPQYVMLPGIVLARIGLQILPGKYKVMAAKKLLRTFAKVGFSVLLSFGLVLAPWHFALYKEFGATLMTTSVNEAPLFYDLEFYSAAIAEYEISNRFGAVHEKIMALAKAADRTFQEQVAIEKAKISAKASESRLHRMKRSMTRFYLNKNNFLKRFLKIQNDPLKYSGLLGEFLLTVNSIAWRFLLIVSFVAFCLPAYPRNGNWLVALSLKGLVIMLTLQPLLTLSHARYHVALIPVLALLAIFQLRGPLHISLGRYRERSYRMIFLLALQVIFFIYGIVNLLVLSSS